MNFLTRGRSGKRPIPRECICKRKVTEDIVKPNLSMTPSEIAQLANQGIAVSTPAADQFLHDNLSGWDIPPELLRSSDRNSLWELSKDAHARIAAARRRDKEKFT